MRVKNSITRNFLIALSFLLLAFVPANADYTINVMTGQMDYYEPGMPTGAAAGDVPYFDGANWQILTAGANGLVLTIVGGLPTWIAGGGGAPVAASYLTLGLNAALTAERVLTAGTGIQFADTGANGTLTIASQDNQIDHDSLLNYVAGDHIGLPNTLAATLTDHDLAAHTALGLYDQDTDVDHDQTTNYVAGQHIGLPNTIAAVLTDHDLAAHTALGLFDQHADVDHDQTTNYLATEHYLEGTIDHGSILGLADDDHTQYIKDSEFTQDGGFLVGTGAGIFQEESPATVLASLSGQAGAAFSWNSNNLTNIGTIGSGTITVVDGSSINLQEDITFTGATTENLIKMPDNLADALSIKEGANQYVKFITTNGIEDIIFSKPLEILHTASGADDHALEIDMDAAGYGDIKAIDIAYITGNISAGEDEGVILINIDEIDATGGDVFGLEVLATDGSAGIYGMKVGVVIGPIHQDSGTFINPDTGTDNTPATDVAAMIDGNSGTTTAIFENDNEYILIGDAAVFEEIEFIITTGASAAGINPTFWYSTAGSHTFTQFTPVDGTNGFKNTGVVAWDASDLTAHGVNTDTSTYDIKVIRTRNSLSTTPILGYAKTAATTEYIWDKDGDISIRNLITSGSATVGSLIGPAAALDINTALIQDVNFWDTIASGNPSINIYGWNTAGGDRESAELTMDDTNDEFLIQVPNSVNNEGVTISLLEANQRWRIRQNSDVGSIWMDGTDMQFHTSDGTFVFDSDEAAAVAALVLYDDDTNFVTIQSQEMAGNWVLTLPAIDGDNNQVLQTDGNGLTSWVANAGGGTGTMTTVEHGGAGVGDPDIVTLDFLAQDFVIAEGADTHIDISFDYPNSQKATTAQAGILTELATIAEVSAGIDTTRAVTADGLAGSTIGRKTMIWKLTANDEVIVDQDDYDSILLVADIAGWDLVSVAARIVTADDGADFIDIGVYNVTQTAEVLSTLMRIEAGEFSTLTSAQPGVIDVGEDDITGGDVYRIDVDYGGDNCAGLEVHLTYEKVA